MHFMATVAPASASSTGTAIWPSVIAASAALFGVVIASVLQRWSDRRKFAFEDRQRAMTQEADIAKQRRTERLEAYKDLARAMSSCASAIGDFVGAQTDSQRIAAQEAIETQYLSLDLAARVVMFGKPPPAVTQPITDLLDFMADQLSAIRHNQPLAFDRLGAIYGAVTQAISADLEA